ncbi:HlyD family efflux transporter periplasmic adaptor subunit [Cellulomonas terrae]|uniref:RND transporter n=1 Tax=Cellulomonas terrae TaxID=311234 RepID=A0A511JFN1_9CELL|nr:HlyD family efflux transporter periplasmic adaptor subunit [Cellulomonas terrae]GEL96804.1 RND transporter [Cellulomonas terrae]
MPEQTASPSLARRRRTRRRRMVALGAAGAVVLVAAGGGVALAVGGSDDGRYRTATAERASVEQVVDTVGTIASANRRDASFSVDGTVADVRVTVGQVVGAGDVLATLDTEALQGAVERAEADLAAAQQQLSDHLDAQTSSDPTPSPSTSSLTSADTDEPADDPTAPADPADPAVERAAAEVRAAQQALLDQYRLTADALDASGESVSASQATCAAFLAVVAGDVDTPDPTPTATEPPATDTTDTTDATDTTDPTDTTGAPVTDEPSTAEPDPTVVEQALADCQAALTGTLDAQTATDAEQQALLTLAAALDEAVRALQEAETRSSSSPTTTTSGPSTSSPSTDTPSPSTPSPSGDTTTTVTAATIVADQAAIDLAEANVTLAQSRLPFATLTSPIAGTVAAVSLAPGDAVTASSTTVVVTVLGPDGYTVTTSVPLTSIDIVEVGQTAQVTTPSTDATLTGTVSSIGVLDTSTTADPAYTVELAVDPTDERLYDDASAQVRITVAGADEVLTVPTSAVHVDGTTATVQVLEGGTPTEVTVTRGAVGAERTEITDGLAVGDEVVLADLDEPIESGTSATTGLSGLGGDQVEMPGPPEGFVMNGDLGGGPPAGFTQRDGG